MVRSRPLIVVRVVPCALVAAIVAGWAAPARGDMYLKQKANGTTTTNSITATWGSATTAGSLMVAVLTNDGAATYTPPASQGWTSAVRKVGNGANNATVQIYYTWTAGSLSGGSTWGLSATVHGTIEIMELPGGLVASDPLDQPTSLGGTGTVLGTNSTITTVQADEYAIAAFSTMTAANISAPTNSFTLEQTLTSSSNSSATLVRSITSIGLYSTGATADASIQFVGALATFKAATVTSKYWFGTAGADCSTAGWKTFNDANCGSSAAPTSSQTAIFPSGATSCTYGTSTSIGGLQFDSGYAGTMTIGSNVRLTTGSFTNNAGSTALSAGSGSTLALLTSSNVTFNPNGVTFANLTLNDGLINYYKLDEANATDNAVDSSGMGNDCTQTGSPTVTSTVPSGLSFPDTKGRTFASGKYLTCGVNGMPNASGAPVSISMWFNDGSVAPAAREVMVNAYLSGVGWYLGHPASTTLGANTTTSSAVAVLSPYTADTGWHHMVYTNAGTTQTLYVDGVQKATGTFSTWVAGVPTSFVIGQLGDGSNPFAGDLDEIRVYNRVLTASDARDLYNGRQRVAKAWTFTLSSALNVTESLTLASGELDVSASNCSGGPCGVTAGSWAVRGGIFTARTGTVTFSGAGSYNILSGWQQFGSVHFGGTGTWTLLDRLFATGTLTLDAAGTIDQGSTPYHIQAGGLVKSAGTIQATGGSGNKVRVVSASSSTQPMQVNSLTATVAVESTKETNLVGYWKLDEGTGTTARDALGSNDGTIHVSSANNELSPKYSTSCASTAFDNPACYDLEANVSDYIDLGTSSTLNPTSAITISAWVNREAVGAAHTVINRDTAYELTVNSSNFLVVKIYGGGSWRTATATGSALSNAATWYHVALTYDGTTLLGYVNGANPTGASASYTGTVNASSSNTYLGKLSTGTQFFDGKLDDVRIYSTALSATQIAALYNGDYPQGTGGTTWQLSGSSAVTGTFSVYNGVLDANGYDLSVNGGNLARIRAGELKIGSSATGQAFTGGLQVDRYGKLSGASSAGVVKLSAGTTLAMNGTLQTTSGSTAGPTIQSASGTYTFSIGTASGETPALDVNGLAVQNTDASGMYVNSSNAATVAWTRFNNVAFSNGTTSAGARLLRIYSTSMTGTMNDCLFARGGSESNVTLAGDGSGGEARLYMGNATCTGTTDCEAWDDDADNADASPNNGQGTEVIQWVYRYGSDTSGTVQGFPTAAFDWNTFAWYSTYVVMRDASSGTDRIYVRDEGGDPMAWSTPSFDVASTDGDIVGAVRFNTLSEITVGRDINGDGDATDTSVHVVYFGTTTGKIFRLVDTGSALTYGASPWNTAKTFSGLDEVTSPLVVDGAYIYFAGEDVSNNPKTYKIDEQNATPALVSPTPTTIGTRVNAAPALSGGDLFLGTAGFIYRITGGTIIDRSNNCTTAAVSSRVTIKSGVIYASDDAGRLCAINNDTTLTTSWSQQDAASHAGTCAVGGACAIKGAPWVEFGTGRIYYGDNDGHIYVRTSDGSLLSATYFPYSVTTESFQAPVLYKSGIIAAGTTSGSVFFIDQATNASNQPAIIKTYYFSAAISGIAYDQTVGRYLIATGGGSGKIFTIGAGQITDPTPSFE